MRDGRMGSAASTHLSKRALAAADGAPLLDELFAAPKVNHRIPSLDLALGDICANSRMQQVH